MLNKAEFAARRHALLQRLPKDSVAIVNSAPEMYRSHDIHYSYRQNSDFYYLTGFNEPDAIAVLIPGRAKGEFVLFNRSKSAVQAIWTGDYAGQIGAINDYGADEAFPISDLNELMPNLLADKQRIYYAIGGDQRLNRLIIDWIQRLQGKIRTGIGVPAEFINLDSILHEMRLIKSTAEIAVLRHAAKITAQAHRNAMQICRPGMMEYQLQAAIEYDFQFQGMMGPAYGTIVGGGQNACTLHYVENNSVLDNGDLVLIDAGCEHQLYAADVTRTFPVNGTFTTAQRAIYEVVLDAQLAVLDLVKPGTRYDELQNTACWVLTEGLVKLGILTGKVATLIDEKAYLPFYMHRVSHWLGMDTHDVGAYKIDQQWRQLEPGMVLTVEPGLYIAADNDQVTTPWHGIGIRIEDDVLVTLTGHEVLSADAPKTIADIEALCAS